MKINDKSSIKTLIWVVIVALFGIVSGIAVWLLTDREELINEPEKTVRSTVKSTD